MMVDDAIHIKDLIVNDSTVASLKKYLNRFPDDAKLIFVDVQHNVANDYYRNYVVQICCNFEHQINSNTVMLMKGYRIREEE